MRQREILNAAKVQAGMTQKEFAKYFGIPLSHLCHLLLPFIVW